MSLKDFFGTYEVEVTNSTPFGSYSQVEIRAGGTRNATIKITPYNLDLTDHDEDTQATFEADYDPAMDSLWVDFTGSKSSAVAMYISRYVEPALSYCTIYSVIRLRAEDQQSPIFHQPTWTATMRPDEFAKRLAPGRGAAKTPMNTAEAASFAGDYVVRSTANAQFGTFTHLTITEPDEDGYAIFKITYVDTYVDENRISEHRVWFDAETCTLQGDLLGEFGTTKFTAILSMSLSVPHDGPGRRLLYGSILLADPEQGGTFVAEDEGD